MSTEIQHSHQTWSQILKHGFLFLIFFEVYAIALIYFYECTKSKHEVTNFGFFQIEGIVGSALWVLLQAMIGHYHTFEKIPVTWKGILGVASAFSGLILLVMFKDLSLLLPKIGQLSLVATLCYAQIALIGVVLILSQGFLMLRCLNSVWAQR